MGGLFTVACAATAAPIVGLPKSDPRMAIQMASRRRCGAWQDNRVRLGFNAVDRVRANTPPIDTRSCEACTAVAIPTEGHVRYPASTLRDGSRHGTRDFWATASMVVASFHTLRDDRRGARQRLLDADAWDLVIVDEAHHLSVDQKSGETLAYSLVSDLEERKKINSLLFFTGTPHRGKDFGFFGLMHLVRPDLFDRRATN